MTAPAITALDHVALEVPELEPAIRFYEQSLGLTPLPTPPAAVERGIRWYALPEGRMLHLVTNPDAQPHRIAHVALRVNDVDAWRRHLHQLGVAEEQPMVKLYGDVDRMFVRDPGGNRIELVCWGESGAVV